MLGKYKENNPVFEPQKDINLYWDGNERISFE
jgi:hypothetical protein